MSDNKKEVLNGYEQLKRKNRRRLVGASALVVVAGGLLASTLSGSDEPEQNVVVATASAPTTMADEDIHAKELAEAAVLEPTSDEDTSADDKVDESEKPTKQLVKVQDQVEEDKPVQAEQEKPAKEESDMGPPLVIINNKLVDSDIKGLEESERIQKAEAAKREAAEKRAKERQQRLAAQREAAAKKRAAIVKAENDEKTQVVRSETKHVEKAKVEPKEVVVKPKSIDKPKSDAKVKSDTPKVKIEDKKVVKSTDTNSKKDSPKKTEKKVETSDKKVDTKAKSTDKSNDKAKKDSPTSSNKDKAKAKSESKATIQAGYTDKFKAHQLAKDMNSAGINARVIEVPTDKGTIYRVKTGTYPNRKAADYALGKLRQKGVGGTIVDE